MRAAGAVTWPTALVEFSLSSSQPEDATARDIPTFPELGTKEAPGVPGLRWRRKTSAETKKAGSRAGLSASHFAFRISCCRPG